MTRDTLPPEAWGFVTGLLLPVILATALPAHRHKTDRQLEQIAYQKCGPEGTVDWDDNPEYPPPHCNRNGWNGHRYVEEPSSQDHRKAQAQ